MKIKERKEEKQRNNKHSYKLEEHKREKNPFIIFKSFFLTGKCKEHKLKEKHKLKENKSFL